MSEHNIFDILKAVDENDIEKFSSYSEEDFKSIQPLVLMRWMSGCKNKQQILAINMFVNPLLFKLSKHKHLLIYCLMACSTGSKRYEWKKKETGVSRMPNVFKILSKHYDISTKNVEMLLPALTKNDIIDICDQMNLDSEEKKNIKKELNDYANI